MGARENLQRLADRKSQEILDLERQIDMARSYLQAIQDSIKALPKDIAAQGHGEDFSSGLRPGTLLARAKDALQKNGAPMHITSLLAAIGVENTKSSRFSLVGSLGGYVRKGAVFTRPAPNTFGLIGMNQSRQNSDDPVLPETFGQITEDV